MFGTGQVIAQTGAKRITISGKVIEASTKKALPGVTVIVVGTQNGAITDQTGAFTLNTDSGAKLEFTFVGMKPIIKTVTENVKNMLISMEQNAIAVEDVVITGYQTISKERATGSFATIDTKRMEVKLQSNLGSMLEGQVAGLVRDKDGNIEIRGVSTLSAEKKPLIVLDGFPYDGTLESINNENIDNITILKDGVAASIYGSRAANGVIVVTTKSGREGRFSVSYKGVFSATMNSKFEDFNRGSTSDFIDGEIAIFNEEPTGSNNSYNSPVKQLLVNAYNAGNTDADYAKAYKEIDKLRNNDAFKDVENYVQRTKMSHSHNIGINGGNDKNLFNASINYLDEYGSMIHDKSSRFIFDVKNIWKPKKWLTFDLAANINYTQSERPQKSWQDLVGGWSDLYPYENIADSQGNSLNIDPRISPYLKGVYDNTKNTLPYTYNPIDELGYRTVNNSSFRTRLTANLNFKIIEGLSISGGGVWTRENSNWKTVDSKKSFFVRNIVNGATDKNNPVTKYFPNGDIVNENRNMSESWTIRGQVNLNKAFNGEKHRVTALIGTEVRKDTYNNNRYATRVGYNQTAGSYTIMNIKDWNAGKDKVNMIQNPYFTMNNGSVALRDNRFVSYFGNASYEFDNRYIISGSARLDLTNFFGTDPKYRYKPLWSIGGTWKLSQEKFFDVSFIDMLNLRASYGINGNISLNQGPFLILSVGSYSDVTGGTAYGVQSPPNNQLRWEKTATTNIGADLGLFNNKLNFTLDYYNKLSTDLLASDAVDPIVGFSSLTKNVGSIQNRGFELSVSAYIIEKSNFRWFSKFNYAYNNNKVLEYNVSRPYTSSWTGTLGINAAGYPANALFATRFAGLNDSGSVQGYDRDNNVKLIADLAPEDVVYMGTSKAPHDLSFTNDFTYKNFNLSFMFVAKLGSKYRRDTFTGSNYHSRYFKDRWQKPGDEATTIYPKFSSWNMDMWDFPYTDVLVQSSSFLKLRDITLTYSLPKRLLSKIGFSDVKIYAQSRNLFRVTGKNVDIDPETIEAWSGGSNGTTDPSYTSLPRRPEFYVGLSFNF